MVIRDLKSCWLPHCRFLIELRRKNLGLSYLAAVLRSIGCSVRIIDGWLEGLSPSKLATEILNAPPTLFLGFSCYRSNMERTIEVINRLRHEKLAIPIIVGGFGPTFHPDAFLEAGFDIVVRVRLKKQYLIFTITIAQENPFKEYTWY